MATDGPTPDRCDSEIFDLGKVAFYSETYGACAFEALVKQVAKETQTRTDWHYVGWRAVVLTLGDVEVVEAACKRIIAPEIAKQRGVYAVEP